MVVAASVKDILETLGAQNVFTATTESRALSVLSENDIALAVLDIKLEDQACKALALSCLEKKIPMIFATGYGSHPFDIKRFGNVPIVVKPYGSSQLARVINAAMMAA